jgi:hypothetical protein
MGIAHCARISFLEGSGKRRKDIVPNERVDNNLPADADSLVAQVYLLCELADTAKRFVRALDIGDMSNAELELSNLRGLVR